MPRCIIADKSGPRPTYVVARPGHCWITGKGETPEDGPKSPSPEWSHHRDRAYVFKSTLAAKQLIGRTLTKAPYFEIIEVGDD